VLLDLGNLADTSAKYEVVLDAATLLGYDALAFGPLDSARCPELPSLVAERGLVGLAGASQEPDAWFSPLWTKDVGTRRLGVVHVQTLLAQQAGPTDGDGLGQLESALRAARTQCDVLVVISRLGLAGDRRLLARPGARGLLDLLIEVDEALSQAEVQDLEGTPVLLPRRGGGEVGELRIDLGAGQAKFAVTLHAVTREAPLAPDVDGLVNRFLAGHAKEAPSVMPTRPEWGYASAAKCVQCHVAAGTSWAGSRHAAAVETLQAEGRLGPDCLRCHSEYFRHNRVGAVLPKGDDGVQCATCHGDGVVHSATGVQATIVRSVPERVCVDCHDQEHSPHFEYDSYLQRMAHG